MHNLNNWIERYLLYIGLAVMGGALGYLMRLREGSRVRWPRVLLEAMSAGFVGFLVLLLCMASNMPETWAGLTVGVSGWLGANATIGMLERVIYSKLGLSNAINSENHDSDDCNDQIS